MTEPELYLQYVFVACQLCVLIRASLRGYKRAQQRQSLSVSFLCGEHKHHQGCCFRGYIETTYYYTRHGRIQTFGTCNSPIPHQPQQTSVSTTIRAIAVRLPVFDKMSAAAFDALMSKTMEHFLGPLLSIGCRGSCLLTEPVS